MFQILICKQRSEGKAILLHCWTGPECSRRLCSQISRQSAHEGGKVVSPKHRPLLPPESIPGTHFCQRLSRPQGHSAAGRITSMKNSSDTLGYRTRDILTCSAVPQTTAPPRTATKEVGILFSHVIALRTRFVENFY